MAKTAARSRPEVIRVLKVPDRCCVAHLSASDLRWKDLEVAPAWMLLTCACQRPFLLRKLAITHSSVVTEMCPSLQRVINGQPMFEVVIQYSLESLFVTKRDRAHGSACENTPSLVRQKHQFLQHLEIALLERREIIFTA